MTSEPYSRLELVRHDSTANAPERDHGSSAPELYYGPDHPEMRASATAFDLI